MKNSKINLWYRGACQYQDKIWFLGGEVNGLFSVNLHDFSVEYKQKIPYLDEQIPGTYYGSTQCIYDNKILFFPMYYEYIIVYDVEDDEIHTISIEALGETNVYCTAGIVKLNNQVWIFPVELSQGILQLDLSMMKVAINSELDGALEGVEYIYNSGNVVRTGDFTVAILSGQHSIVGIDLQSKERMYCKQFEEISIWGIRYDGSDFWFLLYDSTDIFKWNQKEDSLEKYQLVGEEWIDVKGVPYSNIIFVENQIILLPGILKYIMRIDKENHTIRKAVEYPKDFYLFESLNYMLAFEAFDIVESTKILLHPLRGNMLLIYDIETNEIEGKELAVTEKNGFYLKEIVEQRMRRSKGILEETDNFGIEVLDLAIMSNNREMSNQKRNRIGEDIYNAIVK